jgi:hypothetical protein
MMEHVPSDTNQAMLDAAEASDAFETAFDQQLDATLDLSSWSSGPDLEQLYSRLSSEVGEALKQQARVRDALRHEIIPALADYVPEEDRHLVRHRRVTVDQIEHIHRRLLFPGHVEAVDGTSVTHDTVALTVTSLGISAVSYLGDQGTWQQRLYRRDLRYRPKDAVQEARALLEARSRRGAVDQEQNPLSELARRALMEWGERSVLLDGCTAEWRMGHGTPATFQLLTGSGLMSHDGHPHLRLLPYFDELLRRFVDESPRWVFVASEPSERLLITLGHALDALEYLIVGSMHERLRAIVERGRYGPLDQARARALLDHIGPSIVIGVYRASRSAPPHLFYAHESVADEAAILAIADSTLQEHRGFPLLIDLADRVCKSYFDAATFQELVGVAYAESGAPYMYQGERRTR